MKKTRAELLALAKERYESYHRIKSFKVLNFQEYACIDWSHIDKDEEAFYINSEGDVYVEYVKDGVNKAPRGARMKVYDSKTDTWAESDYDKIREAKKIIYLDD